MEEFWQRDYWMDAKGKKYGIDGILDRILMQHLLLLFVHSWNLNIGMQLLKLKVVIYNIKYNLSEIVFKTWPLWQAHYSFVWKTNDNKCILVCDQEAIVKIIGSCPGSYYAGSCIPMPEKGTQSSL